MTGIERLRELGNDYAEHSWSAAGRSRGILMLEVADQIELELREERDRWDTRVTTVYLEMNKHILGHEGMEDSPVARWARELRRALKSDTSDERDAQNPSCTGTAEKADVTSEAAKVTRDPAEDVSVSAYDLLPADERDAIAWVREHGGLDSVKKLLDWVIGHCSTKQQLDFDFWLSGRVMHELGFEEDRADRDEVERRLLARLMPDGMEWMLEAWPRFEDDSPVRIGDEISRRDDGGVVNSIELQDGGYFTLHAADGAEDWILPQYFPGERVKRPAVLAADGEPLREGEHVWHVETGAELVVKKLPKPGEYQAVIVFALPTSPASHLTSFDPDQLTHERPDSYDALWEDIENCAVGYSEFVRRAKALAGDE